MTDTHTQRSWEFDCPECRNHIVAYVEPVKDRRGYVVVCFAEGNHARRTSRRCVSANVPTPKVGRR